MQTLRLAEQHGINTVFETGAQYVDRYNREFRGHMQFIPHIEVAAGQTDTALQDHIKQQVDTGAVALYVWGVSGDTLVRDGAVDRIHKAVEMAKASGLPVGVGSHSLLVPMACEKAQVPCDFYVKTLKRLAPDATWTGAGIGKDQITLKCGSAEITLKKNGDITIKGKDIQLKGDGNVILKGSKVTSN